MNPYSAVGNAVLIQHRENEVSVLAHFKLDSIKVKVGDKVTKGQLLVFAEIPATHPSRTCTIICKIHLSFRMAQASNASLRKLQ